MMVLKIKVPIQDITTLTDGGLNYWKMWSKGVSWINDVRIPFVDEKDIPNDMDKTTFYRLWNGVKGLKPFLYQQNTQGRFPANLLVSDDMLNDGTTSKSTIFDGKLPDIRGGRFGASDVELTDKRAFGGYDDKGTNSRYYDIDKWFDKLLEDVE